MPFVNGNSLTSNGMYSFDSFGEGQVCETYNGRRRVSLKFSSSSLEHLEGKVLVLYTGGTIGMEFNENGCLSPSSNLFTEKVQNNSLLHDQTYDLSRFPDSSNWFALPLVKGKRKIIYKIIEYVPLLDSSNMCNSDWVKIARDVESYYEQFDGFVILHGTDTLSYTASALSFMMENLSKPVVITGSQISIFQITSDGIHNFIGALIVAGNFDIPEVTVFFNNKLIRGNRTIKISSEEFDAFDSPHTQPLLKVGLTIDIDFQSIFRNPNMACFTVERRINKNVGILRLYPDISSQTLGLFMQSPMQGIVLQTYGSGNFPSSRSDLLNELQKACERDVIIVNCSQCNRGKTSQTYETGKMLANIGVLEAFDMTPEATLTKLAYVLSKSEWTLQEKKYIMTKNIRGELTPKIDDAVHKETFDLTSAVARSLNISDKTELQKLHQTLFPAMLQLALYEGKVEKIQAFGAELSMPDFEGKTILHLACSEGKIDVVKYCLEKGVNIHVRDKYDMNPLHEAVIADQHEIIKLLKKAGAHLTNEPQFLGDVLTNSAAKGMITRLQSYLLAGVCLNEVDSLGMTPIHAAVLNKRTETVKFLMSHNVNVHFKNKLKQTPLDLAIQIGAKNIIDLLNGNESS